MKTTIKLTYIYLLRPTTWKWAVTLKSPEVTLQKEFMFKYMAKQNE